MNKLILLMFLLFTTSAFAQSAIKVTHAQWGTKDVTSKVQAECDDEEVCVYTVLKSKLGRQGGREKSFEVTYLCEGNPEPFKRNIGSRAQGESLTLDCPDVPKSEAGKDGVAPLAEINPLIIPETVTYYQKLLVRYQHRPQSVTLEDFTETFFAEEAPPAKEDDRLLRCKDSKATGPCIPDTYYSWGPEVKMENIRKATSSKLKPWDGDLNSRHRVYMNQSAIGSYCYGEYPVRIKVNEAPDRGGLNNGTLISNFNEWTLDKGNRISSVSYAQPEHLDEIIIEIKRRLMDQTWAEAPLYVPPYSTSSPKARMINGCVPEVLDLREETLVRNIMKLLEAYLTGKSWIHYQQCENCTRDDHFKTEWKTFYNPN